KNQKVPAGRKASKKKEGADAGSKQVRKNTFTRTLRPSDDNAQAAERSEDEKVLSTAASRSRQKSGAIGGAVVEGGKEIVPDDVHRRDEEDGNVVRLSSSEDRVSTEKLKKEGNLLPKDKPHEKSSADVEANMENRKTGRQDADPGDEAQGSPFVSEGDNERQKLEKNSDKQHEQQDGDLKLQEVAPQEMGPLVRWRVLAPASAWKFPERVAQTGEDETKQKENMQPAQLVLCMETSRGYDSHHIILEEKDRIVDEHGD
ncbi:unnamed protein product, partial [Amoebophrya sp. A120]